MHTPNTIFAGRIALLHSGFLGIFPCFHSDLCISARASDAEQGESSGYVQIKRVFHGSDHE